MTQSFSFIVNLQSIAALWVFDPLLTNSQEGGAYLQKTEHMLYPILYHKLILFHPFPAPTHPPPLPPPLSAKS
jgi:hypothetical protein